MRRIALLALLLLAVNARAEKRALLIGINNYSASRFARQTAIPPDRDWADLHGAINDVAAMKQMLVLRYGFEERNIVTLTDQQATRTAILQSIEQHLRKRAAKGDVLLYYFGGHGSQVRNTLSDESDRMDESIVPADSRAGAPDIRDKELRPLFNAILDRGARLTVILDNCHSGSGARGFTTLARPRSIQPDLRDVADRTRTPRPEDRGALVLSAAQDFDQAWETRDEERKLHGAFSWALLRAMRDALPAEPASETFLRAQARLHGETPFQSPVLAGSADARQAPLLGASANRGGTGITVFVEKVRRDGTIVLQGGWAHGLSVGTELRAANMRLKVTNLLGLGRSEAQLETRTAVLKPGARLEVSGWTAPVPRPMRVSIPRIAANEAAIAALAQKLKNECARRGVHWISDPTEVRPARVLRPGEVARTDAIATIAKLPAGSSLFVQFPVPAAMADRIDAVRADRVEDADYVLVARHARGRLEYAWVHEVSGVPIRTAWVSDANAVRESLDRLRRIHAWTHVESPERSPYRLVLRRTNDAVIANGVLAGGERYEIVLRAAIPPSLVKQRYVYVFVIDSEGEAVLLFPRRGSVENRLPLALPTRQEIALGGDSAFEVSPPYGIDRWFLLTTEEPLPYPWILQWDGLRSRPVQPGAWSLERTCYQSVPPRHKSPAAVSHE